MSRISSRILKSGEHQRSQPEPQMTKILLDTDIGTDVDDAVCLAYLLSQPDCELLGITTVTGEAEKRAELASVLCRAAGKNIPIYPGAERPMDGEQRQAIAQQAAVLECWPHDGHFPRDEATEFMARTIRRYPGEVTLLTIGPLTNVGMLFSAHPDIPALLAGMVTMGGLFDTPLPTEEQTEWNIAADAAASKIAYEAPVRRHRSVGLNVTQKVVMEAAEVRERFTARLLRPVLDMAEIWFAGFYPCITFHDPLAAATIFCSDVCCYQRGTVRVSEAEGPGRAVWQPSEGRHEIAVAVDAARYFEEFFGVVGASR